jgi:pyruvate/2-oxoglutarate dehydrogenase complex dihydrolipoamide dehydrogenase (E3) component
MGVETITGKASFLTSHCISVNNDNREVLFYGKSIVIATGSSPKIPAIAGLNETPFLTNETVFDLENIPESLCVLGGGPIGSELAQAFARLGSKVSIVQHSSQLLKKEEKEAGDVIRQCFEKEGIELFFGAYPSEIFYSENRYTIALPRKKIHSSHLLVAAGRSPNVEGLGLENARVRFSKGGISVDSYGRTNQKHIWAIGDVMGQEMYTHFAENRARSVFLSLILPIAFKLDQKQAVPRVTYTDPEVASFGMHEKEAIEAYGVQHVKALLVPFSQNDRAVTAGREEGFVKVVTEKKSSKILGATIVGPRAGEMLPELSLAAYCGIPLKKVGKLIHPYPTYNLAIRKAADLWMKEVFLPKLKRPLTLIPWKRYLPITLIVLLMGALYVTGAYQYISYDVLAKRHQELKEFVSVRPFSTPLLFMGVYIVVTAASLPGGGFFEFNRRISFSYSF